MGGGPLSSLSHSMVSISIKLRTIFCTSLASQPHLPPNFIFPIPETFFTACLFLGNVFKNVKNLKDFSRFKAKIRLLDFLTNLDSK